MRKVLFLVFSTAVALTSFSQSKTGMFSGTVKASSNQNPLYEAVITLSSNVFEGKKFAVTDSVGFYKITNLPKGIYSIVIEMEGFDTINYDNIFLPEGMSQGVSVEMRRDRKEMEREKQKVKKKHSEEHN